MSFVRPGIIFLFGAAFCVVLSLNSVPAAAQSEERESYKKEVQEKLSALDRRIDELKEKAAGMKGKAKKELDKDVSELREKQKLAKEEWKKVERASSHQWEKVKADMDRAVQDLESVYARISSRLKEEMDQSRRHEEQEKGVGSTL